ncbi:toprim domain-containing protein [candidate division TA06 bacterium]|nr:toprim domain-containing protein [candidate division TA06 bacterium]
MLIDKKEIEQIKQSHDLKILVESYGVQLKKKGSNYVGLCPFHKEKTPSFTVNPKTQLWHCFGCDAGGDIINFVAKKEGINFRAAYKRLAGTESSSVAGQTKAASQPVKASVPVPLNRSRLLNRVVSFYHQTLFEDQRGLQYLQSRGITDNSIYEDFKLGYSNGTLNNALPQQESELKEALKEIGLINERGYELFYNCVIFPVFDDNQDCVGIYGRKVENTKSLIPNPAPSDIVHLYLPGPRRGVFNWQAAKRSSMLILTESIIDALTLYNAGFKDVIPCYGVNGFTDDHAALFERYKVNEAYICFDRDEAGEAGAARMTGQLKNKGIACYNIDLPELKDAKADVNSFFILTANAQETFETLLQQANPKAAIRSERQVKSEQRDYEKTDSGFTVCYGDRRYEVRGISREGVKLKATVKALSAVRSSAAAKGRFHLDTVDLYSNRSRLFFAKACAVLFSEKEELITGDITKLIDLAESWTPEAAPSGPSMSKSEEAEALGFLKDPKLFDRILEDFETVGLTGEKANKLMAFIAATSRKLDDPLSILIQSRSAAGKSTLQDAVLSLMPPEDFMKYTRLTGQALFYKEEDSLMHKLLAIEEEHGAREASYSIRNIQSSKYLSIAATGKDPVTGKLRTEEYKVKGPVALMITTTEVELDYETSNRFITLTIDESKEMTARILVKQRENETIEGLVKKAETEAVARRHYNAQRLLRAIQVINPFASQLTYPSESLRARRDHKKYLGLIKAIAYLRQYQRQVKSVEHNGKIIEYIDVILDDIELANKLAGEVFGRSLDELSPPSRLLLGMIKEMVEISCKRQGIEPKDYHFTRKDIRDFCKWSDFQVRCHIKQLEDLEYIYSAVGKKGKEYIYELLYDGQGTDDKPFLMGLTTVEQLRTSGQATAGV